MKWGLTAMCSLLGTHDFTVPFAFSVWHSIRHHAECLPTLPADYPDYPSLNARPKLAFHRQQGRSQPDADIVQDGRHVFVFHTTPSHRRPALGGSMDY